MEEVLKTRERSWLGLVMSRLWQHKLAIAGLAIISLFLISAITAPLIAPHNPYAHDVPNRLAAPCWEYLLGKDEVGRCILSRIIYGARISLLIGVIVISIGLAVGVPLGVVSAYYGGKVDFLVQRIVDIMLAFPALLLALMLVALLGRGLFNVMIAVGITIIPIYVRLVRGSVLSIKEEQFVEAARTIGGSDFRIMSRHVLPNCLAPIIVQSTLHIASAILWAAGLGFLGLGVSPPTPEWGAMLGEGRVFLRVAPHVATFPGLAIFITVLGFNLLGDGLRDALDPRLRQR
ncbi:ABC transporter permease [Dehalococcoidia bacterium]|nr:ABC transporter permease [Dehalococcoidia bacterium]MCL0090950.1 ABC transporter permease [Dehalococcoidia bacterium]